MSELAQHKGDVHGSQPAQSVSSPPEGDTGQRLRVVTSRDAQGLIQTSEAQGDNPTLQGQGQTEEENSASGVQSVKQPAKNVYHLHRKLREPLDENGNQCPPMDCSSCGRHFLCRRELNGHVKHHDPYDDDGNRKLYHCATCVSWYKRKAGLTIHNKAVHA